MPAGVSGHSWANPVGRRARSISPRPHAEPQAETCQPSVRRGPVQEPTTIKSSTKPTPRSTPATGRRSGPTSSSAATAGNDPRDMISREGMQKYLRDRSCATSRTTRWCIELVSAQGRTSRRATTDFNGAVELPDRQAGRERRCRPRPRPRKIFLGLQVQCTQCHNHPVQRVEAEASSGSSTRSSARREADRAQFGPRQRDVASVRT